MKKILLIIISISLCFCVHSFAQLEKKHIRSGNKEFEKEKYQDSEVSYLRAIQKNDESFAAAYNLGDALFKQEKYDEAANQFLSIADMAETKEEFGKLYHNLGNSLLMSNKLEESIEAYKEALRNQPSDMETKYNLAVAKNRLKKQQQQQQQQQQQDQQQNQDQQDQQQQQQNQDQKQDQDKQDQKDQQQQKKEVQISKENAERILEALQRDEKELQEELEKEKAKAQKVSAEKNW